MQLHSLIDLLELCSHCTALLRLGGDLQAENINEVMRGRNLKDDEEVDGSRS